MIERTVIEHIEQFIRVAPDAPAVFWEGRATSYRELGLRSARLAALLRARGVGTDRTVAVVAERGVPLIIGLLAVLRAGGAYVPIRPDLPPERMRWIIDDTTPIVIMCDKPLPAALAHLADKVIRVDDSLAWPDEPAPEPHVSPPDSLAYVIYTSGSTGRPKGVMVTRRGFDVQLGWMQAEYVLGARDRVLQLTSTMFDFSVVEIFWPLMVGGALVLPRSGGDLEPVYLAGLANEHAATVVNFVPSLLRVVLDTCRATPWKTIHTMFCGGEVLPLDLARNTRTVFPHAELHNQYGPTETTINATTWHCQPDDLFVPIGRPVADTSVYVLGDDLASVPSGELWIAGSQVARGYLNQPALTAERFVPNPFARHGERMYRTGDRVRQHADGVLEYVGRTDFQVKVRGFRIELGEIEVLLTSHDGVREAVVVVLDDPRGNKQLVAYVVGTVALAALRTYLDERLPAYMVPAAFVTLDALPLTPTGKIDRKALPAVAEDAYERAEYVAPRTQLEVVLAEIWCEVLGLSQVGIEDDFIAIGGNSLSAVQIVARVVERLAEPQLAVDLSAAHVLSDGTIARSAHRIDELIRSPSRPLPRLPRKDSECSSPASLTQEEVWGYYRKLGRDPMSNPTIFLTFRGPLDRAALDRALANMVMRHEALRTVFAERDGQVLQIVRAPPPPAPIELIELDTLTHAERQHALDVHVHDMWLRRYDLEAGPTFGAILIKCERDEHVLVVSFSHINSDGYSEEIFVDDLAELYAAELEERAPLPAPVQPADVAVWHRSVMTAEKIDSWRRFWAEQIAHVPAMRLPRDVEPGQPPTAALVRRELSPVTTEALHRLPLTQRVTPFMAAVAALQILMGEICGQPRVGVKAAHGNRDLPFLRRSIGFYSRDIFLGTALDQIPTVGALLQQTRQTSLACFPEANGPVMGPNTDSVFVDGGVMLNYMADVPERSLPGGVRMRTGRYLMLRIGLGFTLIDGARTQLALAYRSDWFSAATASRMVDRYLHVLDAVATRPTARIDAL